MFILFLNDLWWTLTNKLDFVEVVEIFIKNLQGQSVALLGVEIPGKHDLEKGVPPMGGSVALLVFFPLKNKLRTILA